MGKITARLADNGTVELDLSEGSSTRSFSVPHSSAEALGLKLIELVASTREPPIERALDQRPMASTEHPSWDIGIAENGSTVVALQFGLWRPLLFLLTREETTWLIEDLKSSLDRLEPRDKQITH